VVTLEMPQLAEKRMIAECECQPQIEIRYHTVPFAHRDSYALDVLAGILNGRTGRLYAAMIEDDGVASDASAFQASNKFAGSFSFVAEAKGESKPVDLERAWDATIADLQQRPVTAEELTKVKNQTAADVFRSLENPFFLMIQLAVFDALGDRTYLDTLAERTAAVTAEDVQRVAREYFANENRVVGHYHRKAGTVVEEVPPELAELPAQMREGIQAQLRQIQSIEDPAQVRGILAQVEEQAGQVPAEMRAVLELMRRKLEERLAELEGTVANEGGEQ
jgi:hypothetical protein